MNRILAKRYAFCDFSSIAGFPNPVPTINEWGDYLPRFRGSKYDHPGEHLFNFHECMLEHGFVHEDVLIKLFKFSLEGNAREWCQSLPAVSIHSLKDFHVAFNSYYEKIYSADLLFPECCHEEEIVPSEKFEDVEGSPYLPDLQFKEDSSQLACLLIEESFQGNIDDYTNDCKAALYPVSDAFDISDLKKELVIKEDLSSFFQEVSHDVFSLKIKEEDQQIAHFSKQDQGALSSLIFDEYSHEEEQIPFVDLMNNQPVYNSYELNFGEYLKKCQNHTAQLISSSDGEQYCVENSYPESAEDIEHSFPQISKPACTVLEPGSADNSKQFIMSREISLQPCSYLQTAKGDNYSQEEDMQRFYDLQLKQQQEVFVFSLIDPFAPCLESLSSLDVRALLSKEGRLFFSFEFHINILWFPAFFVSGSKKSASQLFVWLHWKSDYT
jgi:hypothetical protein